MNPNLPYINTNENQSSNVDDVINFVIAITKISESTGFSRSRPNN